MQPRTVVPVRPIRPVRSARPARPARTTTRAPRGVSPSLLLVLTLAVSASALLARRADAGRAPSAAKRKKGKGRKKGAEIDHLRLASLLIRDGHIDRAAAALREVDVKKKGVDLGLYHLLSGIVAVKRADHKKAIHHLTKAVDRGRRDDRIHLLLAQARFRLGQYRLTLSELEKAGEGAEKVEGSFLIQAQCHWRLGDEVSAWTAIDRGLRNHPSSRELLRQKVMLLIDMGLYIRATRVSRRFLTRAASKPKDYVAVGEALRKAAQHEKAALILEEANLRFPNDEKILLQLARAYLDSGKVLSAASLLHRASYLAPKLRGEAAELYRRAGKLSMALLLNSQVTDQKVKMRQRLGLLIELEKFEEAASLLPRLARLGLLADEQVIYAVAFAYYRIGQLDLAEQWLKRIKDTDLFKKAVELRRAMTDCAQRGWSCLQ